MCCFIEKKKEIFMQEIIMQAERKSTISITWEKNNQQQQ